MKRFNAPLGATLVAFSSVFYASYGIWTRLMGDFFSGYVASAIRSVLVVLMLLGIAAIGKQFQKLDKSVWKYMLVMIVASAVTWGPLYFAILQAGIGVSLTVNYACIVIGFFIFGWLLMGEKFTKDKFISAVLGVFGLWLVFVPTMQGFGWLALAAAAISGLASSFNMVLVKKMPFNATQSSILVWTASIIANVIMSFVLLEPLPAIGAHIEWLYLLIFAVSSILASWVFIIGIKKIDAGAAGIIGLLEIVFAVAFGAFLFNEQPGPITLSGVVVVIFAAAIPYIQDYKTKRSVASR
jgi:drug/metabolite transporter (DMT)-like permease